jgi:hypothetical protein
VSWALADPNDDTSKNTDTTIKLTVNLIIRFIFNSFLI